MISDIIQHFSDDPQLWFFFLCQNAVKISKPINIYKIWICKVISQLRQRINLVGRKYEVAEKGSIAVKYLKIQNPSVVVWNFDIKIYIFAANEHRFQISLLVSLFSKNQPWKSPTSWSVTILRDWNSKGQ